MVNDSVVAVRLSLEHATPVLQIRPEVLNGDQSDEDEVLTASLSALDALPKNRLM